MSTTKKSDLPEYEQLRLKGIEYFQMAEMAMNREGQEPLYDQMVENCNFALELVMKALICKNNDHYPKTHDLVILAIYSIRGVKFLHKQIISDRYILPLWIKICGLWDTDKRYGFMELDPLDYDEYFEAYNRIYKWMLNRF